MIYALVINELGGVVAAEQTFEDADNWIEDHPGNYEIDFQMVEQ